MRDDRERLRDVLEAIQCIEKYAGTRLRRWVNRRILAPAKTCVTVAVRKGAIMAVWWSLFL
jgi:hypothetical protein